MATDNAWRRVNVAEAQLLLEKPDLVVYDARDPASYAAGRIGAAQPLSEANLE